MRGSRQQFVFVTKRVLGVRAPRGSRLGDQRLRCLRLGRTNCFRSLICDGMNTDGGYVLAPRVSADFADNLLHFYRYQRLVHASSLFSRHRRSTASGDVVASAS
jgi:hypothetical protein